MFERLLERVAEGLENLGVPYMVIGGQAVLLYGEPRLTKDIDIAVGADLNRLPDILSLVRNIQLTPLVDPDTFTRQTMVLPCADPGTGIRVDLVFSSSPYEQQAMSRTRTVKIGRARVRFASVEDLVIHKLIAGRARDLEDVKSVLVKNPGIDLKYVRHWLTEFSTALSQPFVDRLEQILRDIG
jgi:predicted nucleotidyltransferase